MYFDYTKKVYSDMDSKTKEAYIEIDKKALGQAIRENVASDIDGIVDRWYQIENIGAFDEDTDFLGLLREAEYLYAYGFYIGVISSIGIACEETCKYLEEKKGAIKSDNQYKRLKKLLESGIISEDVYDCFNAVRLVRNSFFHFDQQAKTTKGQQLANQALEVLNQYKCGISQVLTKAEPDLFDMVPDPKIGFKEFEIKYKNMLHTVGLDLQIEPNTHFKTISSIYAIMEIDIATDAYKELTLYDTYNGMPVCVDLTIPQAEQVKQLRLEEGNAIYATVLSKIDITGTTNEFHLLSIDDVFLGNIL